MPSQLYLSKQNKSIFRSSAFRIFVIIRLATAPPPPYYYCCSQLKPNCAHTVSNRFIPTMYSSYDKMSQQLRQQQVNNNSSNNIQMTLLFPPPSPPPPQSPIRFDHCCLNFYIYINIYRWNNTRPQAVKMRRRLALLFLFRCCCCYSWKASSGWGRVFSFSFSYLFIYYHREFSRYRLYLCCCCCIPWKRRSGRRVGQRTKVVHYSRLFSSKSLLWLCYLYIHTRIFRTGWMPLLGLFFFLACR